MLRTVSTPSGFVCKYVQASWIKSHASFVRKALIACGTTTVLSWLVAGNNPPSFFDLLIVLTGFAVTKNRTHCLVVITILIRSPRFNQHQNWLVWHLQCLRKIIRYYWSDVLTNTPWPTHNLEFSMGLLRSNRNQVLSIMFFL